MCSCDQLACAPEFTCTTGHRRSCHHHHHRHHHRNHRHHHLKETAPPGEATSRINRDVGGWDINQRFGSLGNQIGSHLERAPSWKPSWVDISGRLEVPWALTVHVRTLQPHPRNLHEWGGVCATSKILDDVVGIPWAHDEVLRCPGERATSLTPRNTIREKLTGRIRRPKGSLRSTAGALEAPERP